MIIDFLSKAKEKLRCEEKRKGTARNCQAPNWNRKETTRFVVQREGIAMISLEKLWNSMAWK